jgi:crossover junction endodeoxyribonuclease RuvC
LRILGIDPGSLVTGWGLLDGGPVLIDCGVIRLQRARSFPARLSLLHDELVRLVDRHRPTTAAVESPYHGSSARSALQLAHARGVILAVLAGAGVEVAEYTPATVKKSVTGNGRAEKDQVRRMVARLLDDRVAGHPDDLTDALAVALCHEAARKLSEAVQRSTRRDSRRPGRVLGRR